MSNKVYRLKEDLRDALVDIMLEALKKEGGLSFSEMDYNALGTALSDALIGRIHI